MDLAEVKQNVEKLWHVVSTPDVLYDKMEKKFQSAVRILLHEHTAANPPPKAASSTVESDAFGRFCTQVQQLQTKVAAQDRLCGDLKAQLTASAQKQGETFLLLQRGGH